MNLMDCRRARTRDPIEWIETCPEFSWPLVERLREKVLEWEPDLTESIRWNMLCFAAQKLVFGISGCQRHVGMTFFRGTELPDPGGLFGKRTGQVRVLTVKMTRLEDIARPELEALVHAAVAIDGDPSRIPAVKRPPLPMPEALGKALQRDAVAKRNFEALSPSCQREFKVWVGTAKRPETVARRLKETLARLRTGKRWGDDRGGNLR